MGAGLLAKAVGQSPMHQLTHRLREQARSHRVLQCVLERGNQRRPKCLMQKLRRDVALVMRLR